MVNKTIRQEANGNVEIIRHVLPFGSIQLNHMFDVQMKVVINCPLILFCVLSVFSVLSFFSLDRFGFFLLLSLSHRHSSYHFFSPTLPPFVKMLLAHIYHQIFFLSVIALLYFACRRVFDHNIFIFLFYFFYRRNVPFLHEYTFCSVRIFLLPSLFTQSVFRWSLRTLFFFSLGDMQ